MYNNDLDSIPKYGRIYLPRGTYTANNYGMVSFDLSSYIPSGANVVSATQIYESYMGTKDVLPVVVINSNANGVDVCGFSAGASVLIGLHVIYAIP